MQHDEREPGAERSEADDERPERGSDASTASPDTGRDETPTSGHEAPTAPAETPTVPAETPSAADAWPREPASDTLETAEWRTPAPATTGGTVAESTQCPRCGTENPAGLAFCRNCGQRLVAAGISTTVDRPGTPEGTMACPRCGTHNRAGVAFCQNCGANLRGVGRAYVPPAATSGAEVAEPRRGAILGPVVLLIGLVGLATAYLLPFAYGSGSLWERGAGPGGWGVAFWSGYPEVGAALSDQVYFGLAGPVPLLGLLLVLLAIAGFVRATPGPMQTVGLALTLLWSVGLAVMFVLVELVGNWDGDLVSLLSLLTPAGIILFLSSLIVLIGTLTRFGRS